MVVSTVTTPEGRFLQHLDEAVVDPRSVHSTLHGHFVFGSSILTSQLDYVDGVLQGPVSSQRWTDASVNNNTVTQTIQHPPTIPTTTFNRGAFRLWLTSNAAWFAPPDLTDPTTLWRYVRFLTNKRPWVQERSSFVVEHGTWQSFVGNVINNIPMRWKAQNEVPHFPFTLPAAAAGPGGASPTLREITVRVRGEGYVIAGSSAGLNNRVDLRTPDGLSLGPFLQPDADGYVATLTESPELDLSGAYLAGSSVVVPVGEGIPFPTEVTVTRRTLFPAPAPPKVLRPGRSQQGAKFVTP